MRLKSRTAPVIIISSIIISSVLGLTIFGFYAYLEWKEKNMRRNYRISLCRINADLYKNYIKMNVSAKIEPKGPFRDKPIVEGTIKNNTGKNIYSLKLEVEFYDSDKNLLYKDFFYPIGLDFESLINLADIADTTKNFLLAGDSVSFKHQLNNCPTEISKYLKARSKFAKAQRVEAVELVYKMTGLEIR